MTGLRWRRVLLLAVFPLLAGGAAAQSPPPAWQSGGQIEDAATAHMATFREYKPRQEGGSICMGGK